ALRISSSFIVEEEEHPVFSAMVGWTTFTKVGQVNWTTDAAAILVTCKLRSLNSVFVVEETVGCGGRSAVVLAERTMELVRTALGDQFDLTATAATFCRGWVRGHCAKFLNGIDRRVAGSCKRLARDR